MEEGKGIEFRVYERPPKKHGEKSMWDHEIETPRIISLRENALKARKESSQEECFHSLVELEIIVYASKSKLETIGDLDNFITGICDSLQDAHPMVDPHEEFEKPEREEIYPNEPILIEDDSKVVSIDAKKEVLPEDKEEVYYRIAVHPVQHPDTSKK